MFGFKKTWRNNGSNNAIVPDDADCLMFLGFVGGAPHRPGLEGASLGGGGDGEGRRGAGRQHLGTNDTI